MSPSIEARVAILETKVEQLQRLEPSVDTLTREQAAAAAANSAKAAAAAQRDAAAARRITWLLAIAAIASNFTSHLRF